MIELYFVASFTGAWIETPKAEPFKLWMAQSHPLRVRGLKPLPAFLAVVGLRVASFTGAWIET